MAVNVKTVKRVIVKDSPLKELNLGVNKPAFRSNGYGLRFDSVENDYGTITAKILIYNSWWFEVLLLVIIVNLNGSIFVNKLISKKKWTMFLFHVAFAIIIWLPTLLSCPM